MGISQASIRTPAAGIWCWISRGWTSLKAHQGVVAFGPSSFACQAWQIVPPPFLSGLLGLPGPAVAVIYSLGSLNRFYMSWIGLFTVCPLMY